MSLSHPSRPRLIAEFVLLFVILPVVMWLWLEPRTLFGLLWAVTFICLWIWKKRTGQTVRAAVCSFRHMPGHLNKLMLVRFLICAALMVGFLQWYEPSRLFGLPQERTVLWALIMVFYPLLSVFPQEVIYRLFFYDRYDALFPGERTMMIASGLAFGHGHLIFNNWVAYVMSMIGGLIFAHTYSKTRSFPLVWIEHGIYGCFLFTVGLGWYFYTGAGH